MIATHTLSLFMHLLYRNVVCVGGRKQAIISDVNVETQQIGGSKMQHMMQGFNPPVSNAVAKLSTEFTLLQPIMVVRLQQTPTYRGIKPLKPSNI